MNEAAHIAKREKLLAMNIIEFFTMERLREENVHLASRIYKSLKSDAAKLRPYAMDYMADFIRLNSIDRLCTIHGIGRKSADVVVATLRHSGLLLAG